MKKHFSISTAIDYPSGLFHLGHAYEKICTDVIARWKRLQGFDVHFSTGTDCHGQKIQRAAEKAGKTPEEFVNNMSDCFRDLCKVLNISHTDFIMTTEERHKKVVREVLKKLEENGDIYKGTYSGLYCVDCETFYTEKDLKDGKCPVHLKELEIIKEDSYFFKTSKYQDKIIEAIKKKNLVWPDKKRKELLNRLEEPLRDLSISRLNVDWGIPLPFNEKMTIFVWVDALINYLSTLNYPGEKFKKYWPSVHVIGTDIVWHHTTVWYSILTSLEIKLPKIIVHGFINLEGEKLSKARDIRIDPIDLAEKYSTDALRYYLIINIPFGEDGDFSESSLITRNNNELVANYGNLFYRVTCFISQNFSGELPIGKLREEEKELQRKLKETVKKVEENMDELKLHEALRDIMELSGDVNKYFQNKKPWADENPATTLYTAANMLRSITMLLYPFMPSSCDRALNDLGVKERTLEKIEDFILKPGQSIKAEILFQKLEEVKKGGKKDGDNR